MPTVALPYPCPLCEGHDTVFYCADTKNYQHTYQRCQSCDLVFVRPECRLNTDEEKARYDMHENDDSEHYVRFLRRLAEPMLDALDDNAIGLDFGSGKSQAMANLFRTQGHQCECYDVFYYPHTHLLNQRYDFIIASEVIEHLYQPKLVFEQWLNMLKPNGILGIMTGFRPDMGEFPNWWYKNDPTHVSLFSEQTFGYLQQHYQLTTVYHGKNVLVFKPNQPML